MNFNSLYGSLSSTSSYAQQLVNYLGDNEDFLHSNYLIFRPSQYDYYLFYFKDYNLSNNTLTSSDAHYIRCNLNNQQYNASCDFSKGYSNLTFTPNYNFVSNIDSFGESSLLYNQYKFYKNYNLFSIFFLGLIFVIVLLSMRRNHL